MPAQEFHMTILGRTIEHLGTQMYKHRAPSIAELVANCWDAGSNNTWINIPIAENYNPTTSVISIMDDGDGMDASTVQECYLVVGRNRRLYDKGENHGRKVMGRKGIGKLAGFGLAEVVTITTWTDKIPRAIKFSMLLRQLKTDAGRANDIKFPWIEVDKHGDWPTSGTLIELSVLKHTAPIEIDVLTETLGRRFSRTTYGSMNIFINTIKLLEPSIVTIFNYPETGYEETTLPGGKIVKYRYKFSQKPIRSKELQGFVIYANERTAQAPPFFFNIESTASSQHSTRYVAGEIIADFLDEGIDDESDVISTDRQELDWEKEELKELRAWGEELSRKILRECAELRGSQFENWVLADPQFHRRIDLLDPSVKKEISSFLKILGQKSEEHDERTHDLADSLIRAYEFRTFHDVIDDIKEAGDDPEKLEEMLSRLHDWKVLESRAILEIVRGRLSIINKLEQMIIQDAPETASKNSYDNLHDLLAEYPWIFNPEWQVFAEEKTLSKQLQEWGIRDCREDMEKKRVDFLAFAKSTDELVIIEMKRPGHPVGFDEIQRLEQYQVELMKARPNCRRVLVYSGNVNIPNKKWLQMLEADDFDAIPWSNIFARAKSFYSHYEAILNGDANAEGFISKKIEVARTRDIIEKGTSHRSDEDRRRGLGNSDI